MPGLARLITPRRCAVIPAIYKPTPTQHTRFYSRRNDRSSSDEPQSGTTTPIPDEAHPPPTSKSPFYFEAGYALFAKRPSRPFPPPFLSPPSGSFSDPLSTHHRSRDRRPSVNGEMIRGITNGDDAVLVSDNFLAANDGVGAWAKKERGHAALWSRLILHFWALAAERDHYGDNSDTPDPIAYLETAYAQTQEATAGPTGWLGTTTASGALLTTDKSADPARPVLWVTQLGDSQVLVVRPRDRSVVFKTTEQWHWFDCPRQLGTNSPDTPGKDARVDRVVIEEEDVVLAMSDGVVDNLWEHEVVENVVGSLAKWHKSVGETTTAEKVEHGEAAGMRFVARELVKAARTIAEDPFAESPFMERAVEEGLSIEGGKLDDISVVAGICRRRLKR